MNDAAARRRQLLAELAPLTSLAVATGRARTSHEAASAALEILTRATDATAGLILFNSGTGYEIGAYRGLPEDHVQLIARSRRAGSRLTAALKDSEQPIVADVEQAPLGAALVGALRADGIGHVLLVGLRAAGEVTGLAALGWPEAPRERPQEAIVLQAAALIAVSVENARLVERLERALMSERRLADERTALESLTLLGEAAPGLEELAEKTVHTVVDLLGGIAGSFSRVTSDDQLVHVALSGVDESLVASVQGVPASSMPSVQRLLHDERPYVQDLITGAVRPESLPGLVARGFHSFAALPVRPEGRLEAIIVVYFDRPAAELADTRRTLEVISRIAGISLAKFRLREGLLASEERYRILFIESPEAILLLTLDSALVAANRAALKLYRTDFETLRAFMASGAGRPDAMERRRRLDLLKREGHATFRGTGGRPDGTTFPDEVHAAKVDIGGEGRYLVLVRDLTDQQMLQQELLSAQKMESISQLVSGVAHELNNPLAAIVAFSQIIHRDERLPADLRDDAGLLVQEANRTHRIVQNLLDFARQRPPERYPTAIAALVDSALALQSYSISAGRIAVELDLPEDLPVIDAHRGQLQQVLLNLTLNAIQAIRSSHPSGHVWISARPMVGSAGQAAIQVSISDDGPGIPEHLRSRLFVPFFSTKEPGGGTGLGLSVSFGIIAAHGGSLRFEPGAGGRTPAEGLGPGATFIVELPAHVDVAPMPPEPSADPPDGWSQPGDNPSRRRRRIVQAGLPQRLLSAAPPARARPSPPRAPRNGAAVPASATEHPIAPRVLVVDDEPSIRRLLARTLRDGGFEPILAANGPEAIGYCRDGSFDALLVDHRMPGMSGTEVYDAIVGARPELAGRVVFMSGDVLNPELGEFAKSKFIALLAKPFDVDALIRVLGQVVGEPAGQRGYV